MRTSASARSPAALKNATATPRAQREAEIVKPSFRDRQFAAREAAILDAANRLLTTRGYELMVLDDIAAEVGVAKGSLYKHFESKEALAGAAMKRLLQRLIEQLGELKTRHPESPLAPLRELLRWSLTERAAGRFPTLPSTNTALVATLMKDTGYISALSTLTEAVGELLEKSIKAKLIKSKLPLPVVMFTIYAKTCDPSFDYLRATGTWNDQEVVDYLVQVCFDGLCP